MQFSKYVYWKEIKPFLKLTNDNRFCREKHHVGIELFSYVAVTLNKLKNFDISDNLSLFYKIWCVL